MCGNKMKTHTIILLILIFLLVNSILFAQTETLVKNDSIRFKFNQKYVALSPLISPRICFGLLSANKFEDQKFNETILYVHAFDTFSVFKVYGIAIRGNSFISENKRSGMYLMANVGVDYLQYEPFCFDPGGSNCDDIEDIKSKIFPNIAVGLGYSFKIRNNSFFRLELDIGFKCLLSNIYISYVW